LTGPSAETISLRVEVLNRAGLHARPAMIVSMEAKNYEADVELVLRDVPADHHLESGTRADAKNSIELISLGAPQGTRLDIEAVGPDASEAVAAIARLFEAHFGLEPE
jgi:phosphotransferase system HPr (HPr) family protein